MKYLLLFAAVLLSALALLTLIRAPDSMLMWKLAILAGEFGHWLVLVALGVALAVGLGLSGGLRVVGLALCLFAVVGFLRPVFGACRLAATLPEELREAFGPGVRTAPAFDWGQLYHGRSVPAAQRTTEIFSRPAGLELKLDFYCASAVPDTLQRPRACVVVIHGGGWDSGDRTQLAEWNSRLVAQGYAVAAISYRLAPQFIWPAQRDDVLAAIAWLKSNATRLGIDPARFVLLGRSAGGQLATAVGYGAHDPAIRGVIALYAPHDMPFTWSVSREDDALNSIRLFRQYFGGAPDTAERQTLYESASGQWLARADSPPTLLVHGALDTLSWSRHSERLVGRLRELGVPCYFLPLPWATHGFDFNPDGPGGQLAEYAIEGFLAAELGRTRPAPRL